jgi:hypothetical protein
MFSSKLGYSELVQRLFEKMTFFRVDPLVHGVHGASPSHQMAGAWSTQNQGRPGQGVSAAGFSLARKPYHLELDKEPEAKDVHKDTLAAADRAAMRFLANNRSVRGTTAARMARDTTTTEAAPSWTGIGANYMAWVQALKQDPMSPEAAITINEEAPERAYLAIMNGTTHLSVLHCLHRWKAPNGGCSCFDGALWNLRGRPGMHMASPSSGSLTNKRSCSYNAVGSLPQPSIMHPCSTALATRTTASTPVGPPHRQDGMERPSRHAATSSPFQ